MTDPPAGIAFMGAAWDDFGGGSGRNGQAERDAYRAGRPERPGYGNSHGKPPTQRERDAFIACLAGIMAEARRCIRPGGYALVWALPRTSHWTAMALEDAGWTIRDSVAHMFGSGFPKSHSCLKPAHEVWWLAKAPGPLQPLQIAACRVPSAGEHQRAYQPSHHARGVYNAQSGFMPTNAAGRWPPNTLLSHVGGPDGCQAAGVRRVKGAGWRDTDVGNHAAGAVFGDSSSGLGASERRGYADADGYEQVHAYSCVPQCPVRLLDEQAGPRTSGGYPPAGGQRSHIATYGRPNERGEPQFGASAGSVSRFFPTFGGADPDPEDAVPFRYQSKASPSERRLPDGTRHNHPTTKPLSLMAWLCKLVTKEGGVVLDCFGGSGSTGVAAVREGMRAIIIEQDSHYCDIARVRITHAEQRMAGPLFAGVAPSPSRDAAR